jgi:hypothetical protein
MSMTICANACLDRHDHRTADLILAFVIAGVTFALAYPASAALGVILLQTSPPRGAPDGVMEAFLRAMRDVCLCFFKTVIQILGMTYSMFAFCRSRDIRKYCTCQHRTCGRSLLALSVDHHQHQAHHMRHRARALCAHSNCTSRGIRTTPVYWHSRSGRGRGWWVR